MTPGPGIFQTLVPKGFSVSGINCGVRRYRPDLGLIVSEVPAVAVGVFTKNTCTAAPVTYCKQLLPSDQIKAIITNSGQANAATGLQGEKDNLQMVQALANELNCAPENILTASTGVIGEALSIDKIVKAMPTLVYKLGQVPEKFALAILTTDLVPKTVSKQIQLGSGMITLTGIAKGSGMIHPNMATMLAYFLTDAQLSKQQAQQLLTTANAISFNMISVDGETSTNDSAFLLANGASGVRIVTEDDLKVLQAAINEMAIILAKSIVRDGEGASKLIEVNVYGAPQLELAVKLARSITISPLIKTAIFGAQANWGRIIARLGAEEIPVALIEQCHISIQDFKIYQAGQITPVTTEITERMKKDTIVLTIDLQAGDSDATAWCCDLTDKYIKINAEYLS